MKLIRTCHRERELHLLVARHFRLAEVNENDWTAGNVDVADLYHNHYH